MADGLGWAGICVASCFVTACARSGFDIVDLSAPAPTNWGDYAATLDIPDCPRANPVLTVNTTADELDGGQGISDPAQAGEYLSFAEALWIAGNRGAPHNIYFQADVFPADAPGVIHLRDFPEMPQDSSGLCIDGRRRGVVVEYDDETGTTCGGGSPGPCDLPLRAGALLVGLDFRGTRLFPLDSTVAGCRLDSSRGLPVGAMNSTIGPGNLVFPFFATYHLWVSEGEIRDNDFNFDPLQRTVALTGPFLGGIHAINADRSPAIHGNVFCDPSPDTVSGFAPWDVLVVAGNFFGVDRGGTSIEQCSGGFSSTVTGQVRFGPDNIVRAAQSGIRLSATHPSHAVEVTRNVISGNAVGIEVLGSDVEALPPPAPTITSATRTLVTGECAESGRIEVFSDPGDQGETFLGEASCIAGTPWSVPVSTTAGRNATATLTVTTLDALAYTRTSIFSAPVAIQ